MDLQEAHSLQGLPSTGCSQLTALAYIFAILVLPVPLVPQNRYAWPMRSDVIWFFKVWTIGSCPFTSSKETGRHFLYNAVYDIFLLLAFTDHYYSSPKLIPIRFASLIMEQSESTVFNFPATSDNGTLVISLFFTAAI